MNTASSNATSTSSKTHFIASHLRAAGTLAVIALIAGCAQLKPAPQAPPVIPPSAEPPRAILHAVDYAEVPGWAEDALIDAWPAFQASCKALVLTPASSAIWREHCDASAVVDPRNASAVRAYFEAHFTPYKVSTPDGVDSGVVTGYYEPLLHGSQARDLRYRYPLYAPPDDLLTIDLTELYPDLKDRKLRGRVDGKRVIPYWPRADIEADKAPVAGKELVYVDDAVEAFFLQIQGSGRVQLAEGGTIRVGYADQNGQPYRSIGRVLIDRGDLPLERASMQGIKEWGRLHPDQLTALLDENPSYVFFRVVVPDPQAQIDGPIGALGVPLAAGRTIAVDQRYIPLGAPVFLASTFPLSAKPLNRLVMAQDTGGAIRGPLRADFFWGFGDDAGREAGRMKQAGRMWLLWPIDAAPPTTAPATSR